MHLLWTDGRTHTGAAHGKRIDLPRGGVALTRTGEHSPGGDGGLELLPAPLHGSRVIAIVVPLAGFPPRAALIRGQAIPCPEAHHRTDPAEAHALTVNGLPPLPVAILVGGDEIVASRSRLRLVAYEAVVPAAFTGALPAARCARCGDELRDGDTTVACPACAAWHHEGALAIPATERRACWSYDPRCGACGRERTTLLSPGSTDLESATERALEVGS